MRNKTELPFAASTAASLLGVLSTGFLHWENETFAKSSLQSTSVRLEEGEIGDRQFLDLATDSEMFRLDLNGLFQHVCVLFIIVKNILGFMLRVAVQSEGGPAAQSQVICSIPRGLLPKSQCVYFWLSSLYMLKRSSPGVWCCHDHVGQWRCVRWLLTCQPPQKTRFVQCRTNSWLHLWSLLSFFDLYVSVWWCLGRFAVVP